MLRWWTCRPYGASTKPNKCRTVASLGCGTWVKVIYAGNYSGNGGKSKRPLTQWVTRKPNTKPSLPRRKRNF